MSYDRTGLMVGTCNAGDNIFSCSGGCNEYVNLENMSCGGPPAILTEYTCDSDKHPYGLTVKCESNTSFFKFVQVRIWI